MIEKNSDIFRAGGDALLYLAEPMHKKAFVWGHALGTYVSYDEFLNPLPLYTPVNILDDPPPPSSFFLVAYNLMHGLLLNQKTDKNNRISYSLKYKHPKKSYLRKNKPRCRMKQTFRGALLIKKPKKSI